MDLALRDRVAIVTGAGRGLGRAIALALVGEGARVLAAARTGTELESLREAAPERIEAVECDLLDRAAVADLPARALEAFGVIDIVVNNAGVAPAFPFLEEEQASWDRTFEINVTAPAILCRAAAGHMLAQGSGKIVNVLSTAGLRGKAELGAYACSKAALTQLTRVLAAEWARHGVQVNAVAPGAFETAAQEAVLSSPDLRHRRTRRIPAKRIARPAEIGPMVCLLASPASDFMSGSVVVIDGGEEAKL